MSFTQVLVVPARIRGSVFPKVLVVSGLIQYEYMSWTFHRCFRGSPFTEHVTGTTFISKVLVVPALIQYTCFKHSTGAFVSALITYM